MKRAVCCTDVFYPGALQLPFFLEGLLIAKIIVAPLNYRIDTDKIARILGQRAQEIFAGSDGDDMLSGGHDVMIAMSRQLTPDTFTI